MAEPTSPLNFPQGGVHVATVPTHLGIRVQGLLLDAMESVLVEAGATRVWIDGNQPALTVMAELPEGDADKS